MRGPTLPKFQRRTEQPIRWARLERRWDVNRDVVRAGGVRNRVEGDVFHVVAPRVERSTREGRPPKVAATIRREEFDEKIGQERRRVRERTREMNRSAEADIPPPPDGRDQRFEPGRKDLSDVPEDQRVTGGQGRRERGSRELRARHSATSNGARIKPEDGIGKGAKSDATGPEESSQTPPSTDRQRLEADQPTPPSGQPSREERRRGRSDAQGQPQGREMREDQEGRDTQRGNSAGRINPKNLSKDLLPDNQVRRSQPRGRELTRRQQAQSLARSARERGARQERIAAQTRAARINLSISPRISRWRVTAPRRSR